MRTLATTLCAIAATLAALLLFGIASYHWELNRRQRLSEELQEITQRIKQNPADPAPLRRLAEYAEGSKDWDRTVAFAEMKELERPFQKHPEARKTFEETLLPVIQKGLDDPSAYVRREASLAARAFGPLAQPAIPDLIRTINKYPNEDAAWFAAEALGKMGQDAREAIPTLEEAAKQPSIGNYAAKALTKIRGDNAQQ